MRTIFSKVEFIKEDQLKSLVSDAGKALKNGIVEFKYPERLNKLDAANVWNSKYKEIDLLNKETLKRLDNIGGVYAIFSAKPSGNNWELKYIGQTKSTGSKQRIRAHVVWRNRNTKSGKITGSKFDEVIKLVSRGNYIGISFVEIAPESLRHYVEEQLIYKCRPPWNIHGTEYNRVGRARPLCLN